MNLYKNIYPFFKSLAFRVDPEIIHEFAITSMKILGPKIPTTKHEFDFKVKAFGLNFKNPFGLAAGLDKNGEAIDYLSSIPFGFLEVGTVTPKPQLGNDKPRLFRYVAEESLRNRMGFNNFGGDVVLKNLIKANARHKIVGINLGKNKLTSNKDAHLDYAILYRQFAPHVDYLVINVSSPNTPGLRDLLSEQGLKDIFEATKNEREKIPKPLFVKVSPDMTPEDLLNVVELVKIYKLSGIIATNTTIKKELGDGGISGKLLFEKAKKTRELLLKYCRNNPEIEIIGVGGFSTFEEIKEFWKSGGKLIQIYSSFIFQGPSLLFELEKKLKSEFEELNVQTFDDYLIQIRR